MTALIPVLEVSPLIFCSLLGTGILAATIVTTFTFFASDPNALLRPTMVKNSGLAGLAGITGALLVVLLFVDQGKPLAPHVLILSLLGIGLFAGLVAWGMLYLFHKAAGRMLNTGDSQFKVAAEQSRLWQ